MGVFWRLVPTLVPLKRVAAIILYICMLFLQLIHPFCTLPITGLWPFLAQTLQIVQLLHPLLIVLSLHAATPILGRSLRFGPFAVGWRHKLMESWHGAKPEAALPI